MKKFADILLYFVDGKNVSWNNTIPLKNVVYYYLYFQDVIRVEKLSVNTMMLEKSRMILAHQNGLNQRGVANPPYILYWEFQGHVVTSDT